MIPSAIGTGLLAAIGFWIFGGIALRLVGILLVIAGAAGLATTGDANGLPPVAVGLAAWWAEQLHHALRHGAWKNGLAGRVFERLMQGEK